MTMTDEERRKSAAQSSINYERKHIKRIPLNVPLDFYAAMRAFLDEHMDGVKTNTYVKNALMNQLRHDGYTGESCFKSDNRDS